MLHDNYIALLNVVKYNMTNGKKTRWQSRGSLLSNVYDKTEIFKPQNYITLINVVKYNDIMHKYTHKKREEKVSHSLLLMKNEAACKFA